MVVVQRRSVLADDGYDYADGFEVTTGESDNRSAQEVVTAGLRGTPRWLRSAVLFAHRRLLRFELAPPSAPGHVLGWEVLHTEHDVIRLHASGPLLSGLLVARRAGASTAVLETFVRYRRPVLGRIVWTAVAPVHRAVAPYVMRRAVTYA